MRWSTYKPNLTARNGSATIGLLRLPTPIFRLTFPDW